MNKKLTKGKDKSICGVCSGFANYFDIDPTLVRAITAILFFVGYGVLVLPYLLLALIMPNEQ